MLRPRLLPEARSVHNHDVFLANQFLYKDLVTLRDFDFGVSIKSPTRGNTTHPRRGLAPFLRQIAAGAKFALHFNEMILRTLQCRPDRILLGMIRAQPRPQESVYAIGISLHCG